MTTKEQLDRLTGIVDVLASSVVAHDNQIEGLINHVEGLTNQVERLANQVERLANQVERQGSLIEKNDKQIAALVKIAKEDRVRTESLERQWQAYLNTLRRQ